MKETTKMTIEELNEINLKIGGLITLLDKHQGSAKDQAFSSLLTAQMRVNQIFQEGYDKPKTEETKKL